MTYTSQRKLGRISELILGRIISELKEENIVLKLYTKTLTRFWTDRRDWKIYRNIFRSSNSLHKTYSSISPIVLRKALILPEKLQYSSRKCKYNTGCYKEFHTFQSGYVAP